ncbi:UDP-N-acetylmuramate--L-alanine ligase, partial [candidate division KSB1 bacterium]
MFSPIIKKCHLVGIGGIGMCGIAEMLLNLNFEVTGSDLEKSDNTQRLENIGVTINYGHSPDNIKDPDVVIYSSAVPENNPELMKAKEVGIPIIKRADMLGELLRMKWGIAVTGTHGKTTTTSMVGLVLQKAGFDPTVIVGGKLRTVNSTVKLGLSEFIVAEVDEFDRSILKVIATSAIITNIELEHLDCYKDINDIKSVYVEFCSKIPFYGILSLYIDNINVQDIIPQLDRPITTYGLSAESEFRADNFKFDKLNTNFDVYEQKKLLGNFKLNVPGEHNILNALGCISLTRKMKIPVDRIKEGLESFTGVFRRFEITEIINDIILVDDYAHHPTEISACL